MASDVQICNIALQRLGAKAIVSLTQANSINASHCNLAYSDVRDREIRKYRWNFAKVRVQIAADSTDPIFGLDKAYTIPADCLRVLPGNTNTDWIIEGRKILTDDDAPIDVIYLKREEDPNQFDVNFQESLAMAIALQLCEAITQSNTKKSSIKDDYNRAISEARRANAIESQPVEAPEDTWISERR